MFVFIIVAIIAAESSCVPKQFLNCDMVSLGGECVCTSCSAEHSLSSDGTECIARKCTTSDVSNDCLEVQGVWPSCFCEKCPNEKVPCQADRTKCCNPIRCSNTVIDPTQESCGDYNPYIPAMRSLPSNSSYFTGICTCQVTYICIGYSCQQVKVPCGGDKANSYEICDELSFSTSGSSTCQCRNDFRCSDNGKCINNNCLRRVHACLHYSSSIPTISGECFCVGCEENFVLHNGECLLIQSCGKAAPTSDACISNAIISPAGICTCESDFYCEQSECLPKQTVGCDQRPIATEVCITNSSVIDNYCTCSPSHKCNEGVCSVELRLCKNQLTELYHKCHQNLIPKNGMCVCPDDYDCHPDTSICFSISCRDRIVGCLMYDSEIPAEDGSCYCRRCVTGTKLEEGMCTIPIEDTIPTWIVGILHSTSGPNVEKERVMIQSLELAMELESGQTGTRYDIRIRNGKGNTETFVEQAIILARDVGVDVIFGCYTSECAIAVSLAIQPYNVVLYYAGSLNSMPCIENLFPVGLTPYHEAGAFSRWIASHRPGSQVYVWGEEGELLNEFLKVLETPLENVGLSFKGAMEVTFANLETVNVRQLLQSSTFIISLLPLELVQSLIELAASQSLTLENIIHIRLRENDIHNAFSNIFEGHFVLSTYLNTSNYSNNIQFLEGIKAKNMDDVVPIFSEVGALSYLAFKTWSRMISGMTVGTARSVVYNNLINWWEPISITTLDGEKSTLYDNHYLLHNIHVAQITDGLLESIWKRYIPPDTELCLSEKLNDAVQCHHAISTSMNPNAHCVKHAYNFEGYCRCDGARMCVLGHCHSLEVGCGESTNLEKGVVCKHHNTYEDSNGICSCASGSHCNAGPGCMPDVDRAHDVFFAAIYINGISFGNIIDSHKNPTLYWTILRDIIVKDIMMFLHMPASDIGVRRICRVSGNTIQTASCAYSGVLNLETAKVLPEPLTSDPEARLVVSLSVETVSINRDAYKVVVELESHLKNHTFRDTVRDLSYGVMRFTSFVASEYTANKAHIAVNAAEHAVNAAECSERLAASMTTLLLIVFLAAAVI